MKADNPDIFAGGTLAFAKGAALFVSIFAVGVAGACLIAAVDPPKTRRELFMRGLVAGVCSLGFGPLAVHAVAHYIEWLDVNAIDHVAPVYLLVGALSWGLVGALAMLNKIIRNRGAKAVADKVFGKEDE